MAGMERRKFLKGVLGGVVAGGIIVSATDADIMAFTNQGVGVGDQLEAASPLANPIIDLGHMLFNSDGQPVAVIESIERQLGHTDVTQIDSITTHRMPGLHKIVLTAVVMGRVGAVMGRWGR